MDFPININTISMGLHVYFKGSQVDFLNYGIFLYPDDPDEMQH